MIQRYGEQKIKVSKTGTLIDRPLNKLYLLEVNSDNNEGGNAVNSSLDENYKGDLQINEKVNVDLRPKRQAVVTGEIRQKLTKE